MPSVSLEYKKFNQVNSSLCLDAKWFLTYKIFRILSVYPQDPWGN